MRKLIYLSTVKEDFINILETIADLTGSIRLAENFVKDLREKCAHLASLSATIGHPRPELHQDIRSFPYKNYVIFFRYKENRFEVINILHSHRDINAYFQDNSSNH